MGKGSKQRTVSNEFKTTLGDRIIDRFREGGKLLICDWESYRK